MSALSVSYGAVMKLLRGLETLWRLSDDHIWRESQLDGASASLGSAVRDQGSERGESGLRRMIK